MTTPYYWLNDESRRILSRDYLLPGQTAEQRIEEIGMAAERILGIPGYAAKFVNYMSRGFYSLASPIWSNFGTKRGLSISCNGSYIDDTMESILYKNAEVGMMTKYGAGTSGYFGALRGRGSAIRNNGVSSGSVHFMQLFQTSANVVSQTGVRRGSFAAYLPVDHPDVLEFLQIKNEGNILQDIHFGVCISDQWMHDLVNGKPENRSIWAKIIDKRYSTGYPYLFFTDTVNRNAPEAYKKHGLKIHASNLCSEIALSSSNDESFVCDLSSMNAVKYDEWKDTDAVRILVFLLDAAMTSYIEDTAGISFMGHAHNFAKRQRALGVGVIGYHSYLQSKMIPFESMEAKRENVLIHRTIRTQATEASKELAVLFGEPEILKGTGMRNVTLMAIAPTTSSSAILGQVSPGIEPYDSNYFVKNLAKGDVTYRNPYLANLLEDKGLNKPDIWKSILVNRGSVQHLKELTEDERDVFKTFDEISQKEIVIQAAGRQKWIDQSQSLNLSVAPAETKEDKKALSQLLIFGWEQGVKSFYYQRSANPAQQLARKILACKSCEG